MLPVPLKGGGLSPEELKIALKGKKGFSALPLNGGEGDMYIKLFA